LPASEAARVQETLALLQPDSLPGYPPNTILLLRIGFLFREGLYQEARRGLLAGIAADPNDPTLQLLLGYVYDQMGLKESAAEAFEAARLLSTPPS
jgi:Flp pilus assembly protein TadD